MIEIPPRFSVDNRPLNNKFEDDELLFMRFVSDDVDPAFGNRLPVGAIKFPDFSVNRGLYSQPTDVLIPNWIKHGIAELMVKNIPQPILSGNEKDKNRKTYEFKVEHDPIDINHPYYSKQGFENYAHSEIRVYKDGTHQKTEDKAKIPPTVKKLFRTYISDSASLVIIIDPAPEVNQD